MGSRTKTVRPPRTVFYCDTPYIDTVKPTVLALSHRKDGGKMNGKKWQDELLQPYTIVCNEQIFGRLADIYHALKVMQQMRMEGFNDIYLYQDDDVFPLFSTDIDHDLINDRDVFDAREIVLFRIFQEVK